MEQRSRDQQGVLLEILDELHRLGFQQLRFTRGHSKIKYYIQVYAARSAHEPDGCLNFTQSRFSVANEWAHCLDPHLANKWTELLAGSMRVKHLTSIFIMDFPEIVRPAFGPDDEYRTWFRSLRAFLRQGYLPSMFKEWEPDPPVDFSRDLLLEHATLQARTHPLPPKNPHADQI